jgi:hypothetical protein
MRGRYSRRHRGSVNRRQVQRAKTRGGGPKNWDRVDLLGALHETREGPVLAQVTGIALDDATMASVVAALGSSQQPVEIDRARIERQIRELALEHAGGRGSGR